MPKKFILNGSDKGETKVVNHRYSFVDGEMTCDDDTAQKVQPILCGYFGCVMEDIPVEVDETPKGDGSLSKEVTKTGAKAE